MTESWTHTDQNPPNTYHYVDSGLDNVYLVDGYEITVDDDGEMYVSINDLSGLHKAIAHHLICDQKTLNGKEIRYLRTYLDLSQSHLGRLLGCDSQTVARWEKGEYHIPASSDRLFRLIGLGTLVGEVNPHDIIDKLDEMDDSKEVNIRLRSIGGWKAA